MNNRRLRGDAPDLEIEEAVDLFMTRNMPNWKGETSRTYRKALTGFEEFAVDREFETLEDLKPWNVGQFTDWLIKSGYARATIQNKQKHTRYWLKWLESQGYLQIGTHEGITPLKLDDDEQTSSDILRPEAIREFLVFYRNSEKWRATRRHALLEVIGHTGPRRSGIRALDLGDYDSDARTLKFINRPKSGTRLKRGNSHQRKVVLSSEPNEILREYVQQNRLEKHDSNGRRPLFTSRDGRPAKSTLTNWLYQATLPCNALRKQVVGRVALSL